MSDIEPNFDILIDISLSDLCLLAVRDMESIKNRGSVTFNALHWFCPMSSGCAMCVVGAVAWGRGVPLTESWEPSNLKSEVVLDKLLVLDHLREHVCVNYLTSVRALFGFNIYEVFPEKESIIAFNHLAGSIYKNAPMPKDLDSHIDRFKRLAELFKIVGI